MIVPAAVVCQTAARGVSPGTSEMTAVRWCALAFFLAAGTSLPARADTYGHVQGASDKSENVIAAEGFMADGKWDKAVPLLEARNAGYPDEVETLADLGHAYVMTGDIELGIEKLKVALEFDPKHLEANLYLGEAYLMQKDLPDAEARLSQLDELCFFGCGAYSQLKKDIAAYKAAATQ